MGLSIDDLEDEYVDALLRLATVFDVAAAAASGEASRRRRTALGCDRGSDAGVLEGIALRKAGQPSREPRRNSASQNGAMNCRIARYVVHVRYESGSK